MPIFDPIIDEEARHMVFLSIGLHINTSSKVEEPECFDRAIPSGTTSQQSIAVWTPLPVATKAEMAAKERISPVYTHV